MTTGELITSIIGGFGLAAGIIGFFMARSASKKADGANVKRPRFSAAPIRVAALG